MHWTPRNTRTPAKHCITTPSTTEQLTCRRIPPQKEMAPPTRCPLSVPPIPFRDGIGLGLTALRAECCRRHSARSGGIIQGMALPGMRPRERPRRRPASELVVCTLRAQRARCTRHTWSRCQAERASELVEKTLLRGARVREACARGVPWHARLTDQALSLPPASAQVCSYVIWWYFTEPQELCSHVLLQSMK